MSEPLSPEVRRAMSPLPPRIALFCVLGFALAERGWGDGLALAIFFGALFLVLAGVQLALSRGAPDGARRYGMAVVFTLAGLVCGTALYAVSTQLRVSEQTENAGYALMASLALFLVNTFILLAIELTGAPMREAGYVDMRRVKQAAVAAATLAFAIVGLGLLNVAANKKDARWDLSLTTRTKPSEATTLMASAGGDPVEVFLFFERGSPVLTQMADYFDALSAAGATVEVLDQALDAELAKELKVSRNGTVAVRRGERSETWYVGTDRDAARRKLAQLDGEMRKRLSKLARDPQTVYLTTGHGERGERAAKPGERPAASRLVKMLKAANAKVERLGIADGLGNEVPKDAAAVIIHGPTSPFLEGEVAALQAYVQSGGAVMLLLDPGADHGLDALLAKLGVSFDGAPLVNDKEFVRRTQTAADYEFLYAASFASHKSVKALNDARGRAALLFLRSGSLSRAKGDAGSKPKVTFVARSRKDTWADTDGDRKPDAAEKREVKNFAAAVELPTAGEEARALVVADSDVLSDGLIVADANAAFAYQGALWLLRDDELGGAFESDEDAPIVHTNDEDALWFYGSSVVAPGLVLLVGLALVRRRRKRGAR